MTDNIKLADGTLIDVESGKRTVSTEINRAFSDETKPRSAREEFTTGKRRFLDDLPLPALQSRPVAIVVSYILFGLTPSDIARILNITVDDIIRIVESTDYASFLDSVLQNVREHDTNTVRKKLNRAAEKATDRITELVDSGDEKVALIAAKDVLDRTGNRPVDVTEHRHSVDGGLTIRIINDTAAKPNIEVDL